MSWQHRNGTQSSRPAASALPRPSVGNPGPLAARAPSPHGKRASETGSQGPPKPPRLTATSPVPSVSPLTKRRRAGEARSPPALKVNIPTILVEDEPMEVDGELDGEEDGGAEVRGHRSRPGSPVEGETNGSSVHSVFGGRRRDLSPTPFLFFSFLLFLRGFVV